MAAKLRPRVMLLRRTGKQLALRGELIEFRHRKELAMEW
jgi:hypothetical protein